jgi:glycosyltransferase involved in cell wall biosynthesis
VLAAAAGLHPLAMAAQGQYIAFPPQSRMKRALARYALSRADLVTSWGAHMTRHMIALGCDPAKIRTITYGIDCDRFSPVSSRPRPNVPPRLLTTRAMRRDYNLESILRALREVVRKHPAVVWTAVGDGPERVRLAALAESLGVRDNVELPGRVPLSRLIELLQASDVYVSTVPTDGVSASLLEAMACGAWPVVTDNEANRLWIRPGATGDLVGAEDVSAIARAILEVFENSERTKAAREANATLVRERASLPCNMKVIHRMFQALAEEGPAAVPPVPEHLLVPPPEWSSGSGSP